MILYYFCMNFLHDLGQLALLLYPELLQFISPLDHILVDQSRHDFVFPILASFDGQRLRGVDLDFEGLEVVEGIARRRVDNKIVLHVHQQLVQYAAQYNDVFLKHFLLFPKLLTIDLPRLSQRIVNQNLHKQKVDDLRFLQIFLCL